MTQNICKNCGHHFKGRFCNYCGEKVYTEHDKSIRHFLDETLHFFTHLDNKFFKTLALIFRRPGMLSATYCHGVRNKYYNPVSLFFVGIILYLLFPFLPGLNMSFNGNMANLKGQGLNFIVDLANQKAISAHITLGRLAEKYDHRSSGFAKVLLLIILPLTAFALKAIFPKKRKYFFDYLILATEASSVMLYLNFFILPLLFIIPAIVLQYFNVISINEISGDEFEFLVYAIFIIFWGVKAFRRFFEISFFQALVKGLLFLFLQTVIIFIIYRLILFLTVLLFI